MSKGFRRKHWGKEFITLIVELKTIPLAKLSGKYIERVYHLSDAKLSPANLGSRQIYRGLSCFIFIQNVSYINGILKVQWLESLLQRA